MLLHRPRRDASALSYFEHEACRQKAHAARRLLVCVPEEGRGAGGRYEVTKTGGDENHTTSFHFSLCAHAQVSDEGD